MPKLPIYINLLSKEAQAVIGQVHDNTKPALKLLEREGFCCRDYVDIFDGARQLNVILRTLNRYAIHSERVFKSANTPVLKIT